MSLTERMARAAQTVEGVKKTGKSAQTQGGKPAWSIEDLENSVGDALAGAGVVCTYDVHDLSVAYEMGPVKMWQVTMTYHFSADGEKLSCRLIDIGTSPASAKTFAIKHLLKTFGHVTSDERDGQGQEEAGAPESSEENFGTRPYQHGSGGPVMCPGYRSNGEKCTQALFRDRKDPNRYFCWIKRDGCGWQGPKPDYKPAPDPAGHVDENGEIPPSLASPDSHQAYAAGRAASVGQPLPPRTNSNVIGPEPRRSAAPGAVATAPRPQAPPEPPRPVPTAPQAAQHHIVDEEEFLNQMAREEYDREEAPASANVATLTPARPAVPGDLLFGYNVAVQAARSLDGKVLDVKIDPTVPGDELSDTVLAHAVEAKRIQLLKNGHKDKADNELTVAHLARKGLDDLCQRTYGHPFEQALDEECRELIKKFVKMIVELQA